MVGSLSPDFSLVTIDSKRISLEEYRGSVVLLAFINAHSSDNSSEAQGTRAQLTFLKSIIKQSAQSGLKLVLITGYHSSKNDDDLFNFTCDYELESYPVVLDDKKTRVAELYDVRSKPTTFLISRDGIITQRWDGIALAGQLALAVESELARDDNDEPSVQMIFPGLPGARMISKNVWMIDDGKPWKQVRENPFRLLITGADSAEISLQLKPLEGESLIISANRRSESLSAEECTILLSNLSPLVTKASQVVSGLTIPKPGNYVMRISVVSPGAGGKIAESGEITITVE